MITITSVNELQIYIASLKKEGKTIAYAPTMGALHDGHMSLIQRCKKIADITVCSIFVNPTQFDEISDLNKYPVTIDADKLLLGSQKTDVLFLPSVMEVYPENINTDVNVDLEGMGEVMEGAFRPGHFEGVMQVVKRLLDIVIPDFLVMGQKDFQQFSIIQKMMDYFSIKTVLEIVPIKREKSGLAMSSRNKRLSPEEIETACIIYKTLKYAKLKLKKGDNVNNVIKYAMNRLENAGFRPEYVSISDTKTLKPVSRYTSSTKAVICVAAWLGDVRLIDNIII